MVRTRYLACPSDAKHRPKSGAAPESRHPVLQPSQLRPLFRVRDKRKAAARSEEADNLQLVANAQVRCCGGLLSDASAARRSRGERDGPRPKGPDPWSRTAFRPGRSGGAFARNAGAR